MLYRSLLDAKENLTGSKSCHRKRISAWGDACCQSPRFGRFFQLLRPLEDFIRNFLYTIIITKNSDFDSRIGIDRNRHFQLISIMKVLQLIPIVITQAYRNILIDRNELILLRLKEELYGVHFVVLLNVDILPITLLYQHIPSLWTQVLAYCELGIGTASCSCSSRDPCWTRTTVPREARLGDFNRHSQYTLVFLQ